MSNILKFVEKSLKATKLEEDYRLHLSYLTIEEVQILLEAVRDMDRDLEYFINRCKAGSIRSRVTLALFKNTREKYNTNFGELL